MKKQFGRWEALPGGGRRYRLDVTGRLGWQARYFKEMDAKETTMRFWQEKVHWIRHEKVILDFDLAALCVACRVRLKAFYAVSRLISQSVTPAPGDSSNSSQIVMSSRKHRGRTYLP